MKANAFNPKENSFYGDVEHDFKEIVARIQYNLLMDGYAWSAIDGDVYHLYYDHFSMTGVLFREEDFEEELKETLRRVAETLGYVITGEDCSGIDITIPLKVTDELTYAQKEYVEHLREVKRFETTLKEKAIVFVESFNMEIEKNPYMMNTIENQGGFSFLLVDADINSTPLFFRNTVIQLFHDYWLKRTKAKNCKVNIETNELGCRITIIIEKQ